MRHPPPIDISRQHEFQTQLRADRQSIIDSMLATLRTEGQVPSEAHLSLMRRFLSNDAPLSRLYDALFGKNKIIGEKFERSHQHKVRREMMDSVLGTSAADNAAPGPEVLAFFERYIEGELSLEEVGTSVRAMYELNV